MKKIYSSDYLVLGGGIVGCAITRKLAMRYPNKKIKLLEKESKLGQHNSKLNSGVIHAGLYYPTNSLRAKYCVKGNQLLTQFHREKKIELRECGKLIIARDKEEGKRITDLYKQGIENGVDIELIDAARATKIEPNLKIKGEFPIIYSPNTKVGSPVKVINELDNDINNYVNVEKHVNCGFKDLVKKEDNLIVIKDKNDNLYETKYLINCTGLYSDRIAKTFNTGKDYAMFPLKGTYLIDREINSKLNESGPESTKLNTLVYPLPPSAAKIGSNFLGVHFTVTTDGIVKLGPTALPCFWREQHLGLRCFNITEFTELMLLYLKFLFSNKQQYYLSLFLEQIKFQFSSNVIDQGKTLVKIYDSLEKNIFGFNKLGKRFEYKTGGIRSQIINTKTFDLINDFLILKEKNHIHLLNIISPGWTSAFAIAEDIKFD